MLPSILSSKKLEGPLRQLFGLEPQLEADVITAIENFISESVKIAKLNPQLTAAVLLSSPEPRKFVAACLMDEQLGNDRLYHRASALFEQIEGSVVIDGKYRTVQTVTALMLIAVLVTEEASQA